MRLVARINQRHAIVVRSQKNSLPWLRFAGLFFSSDSSFECPLYKSLMSRETLLIITLAATTHVRNFVYRVSYSYIIAWLKDLVVLGDVVPCYFLFSVPFRFVNLDYDVVLALCCE